MADFGFVSGLIAQCQNLYEENNAPQGASVEVGCSLVSNQDDGTTIQSFGQLFYIPPQSTEIKLVSGQVIGFNFLPASLSGNMRYVMSNPAGSNYPELGDVLNVSIAFGPYGPPVRPITIQRSPQPPAVTLTFFAPDGTTMAAQFSVAVAAEANVLYGLGSAFGDVATNALFVISLYMPNVIIGR
jgi:hypothetical protein